MKKLRLAVAIGMVQLARWLVRLSYVVAGEHLIDWDEELRRGRVH